MREELRGRDTVQFLRQPLVTVPAARLAIDAGRGSFDDHFAMLCHFFAIQQWDRVLQHLESMESLSAGKPGLRWMRDAILVAARGGRNGARALMQRAAELAQLPADQVRSDEIARVDHLLELMEQILAPNEQLVLLNVLQPVFDSQPNSSPDKTHWREYQLKALKSTGRTAQSLALGRQLAIDNPHDARRQQLYARALVDARDYAAAKAWLDGVLVADAQWTASDEASLRNVIAEMYRKQEQYAELVAYLAGWVATNPAFGTAYPQYLSALIKNDQLEQAAQVMEQWHAEGLQPGRLSQPAALRLSAAVELAIGEGFDLRFNRLDPPWPALLAKAVLHFAQQDTLPQCVNQIMSDQGFQETAEYRRVQGEIVQLLSQRSATLPVGHLPHLVDWVAGSASAKDLWPAI